MRLGQNFLRDPNLLDAIVRDSGVDAADCVLEVGVGEGPLTERLAATAGSVHAIEIDRSLGASLEAIEALPNVNLVFADALDIDLGELEPPPNAMVANLPYSVAVPVIMKTVVELPSLERWTVMVQREIADRLLAPAGTKTYGAPSAILRRACEVELVRKVGREVFSPRPRVDSAVISIRRTGPPPGPTYRTLVRAAFAHRRKSLPRSVELVSPGSIDRVRSALEQAGIDPGARAEELTPSEFGRLDDLLGGLGG